MSRLTYVQLAEADIHLPAGSDGVATRTSVGLITSAQAELIASSSAGPITTREAGESVGNPAPVHD
jgi:hypothetical protein